MGRNGSSDDDYSVVVPSRKVAQRVVAPLCAAGHWHTTITCSEGDYLITVLQRDKALLDSIVAELREGGDA